MTRELPFLTVLAVAGAGLVVVATGSGYGRPGLYVISAAILLAGLLRAALPARRAGLLVVRSRLLDVLMLVLSAGAVLALALSLPTPTG